MARLPTPGADDGNWGIILNDYLQQSLTGSGGLKDGAVGTTTIGDGAVTEAKLASAVQTKLNGAGGATNLSVSQDATTVTVASDTGTDAVLAAADASNAGVMTAAQQTKLSGIAGGATANSSDATLLARANHTGTQAAATISDFSSAADARISTLLGNVNNTSDANKPISTATQSALNLKADDSTVVKISGAQSVAGVKTFSSSPIVPTPTNGTDASNKAYADTKLPLKNGNPALTDSTNDRFVRVDISDDGSATSGWPDRLAFYFNGTRTGYHNEYGEVRARPAKATTVALRAMGFGSGTANIFEVAPTSTGTEMLAVSTAAITMTVPLNSTANISTTGTISGSNVGAKVTASSSAPSSPSVGDVWIDLSA
jgi:hypothetical protein